MQPHRPHEKGHDDDFGIPPAKAFQQALHKGDEYEGRPAGDVPVGEGNTVRVHGTGAFAGGRGTGSGGDIDPDMLGLEPALPGRADDPGVRPDGTPNIGGTKLVDGHTHYSGPDAIRFGDNDPSQSGGGIANNRSLEPRQDNGFISEVSIDEATGADENVNDDDTNDDGDTDGGSTDD